MILLIQLLKFLENNKKAKIMLQAYFESSIADVDFGEMSFDDIAEQLPEFLANHLDIELEMKEREKESLVRILKNGTWKSAFSIIKSNPAKKSKYLKGKIINDSEGYSAILLDGANLIYYDVKMEDFGIPKNTKVIFSINKLGHVVTVKES